MKKIERPNLRLASAH